MKKILTFIFAFMIFVIPIKTYADSATVEIVVNGEVKKGSTIEILVKVKDVSKFYAASVDFTYDTNQLKVESIAASDFITKHKDDIMELGGETDKNGNTASYSFTFLGEKDGIRGSGTLAVITAQVLNNENLYIGQDNMKVKLVQRVNDTVENYSFKFSGYNNSANNEVSGDSNSVTDNSTINNNEGNSQGDSSNTSLSSNESNSSEEKTEVTESNRENSNNDENIQESTDENDDKLQNSSQEADNKNSNDYKDNSEEKDLLTSKSSNNVILITTGIILVLVVAVGAIGYYFYKKRNKLS